MACDWTEAMVFVTLTYPWLERPMDGAVARSHLRRFSSRWQRRFGGSVVGLWKREFTRRGALHYHLWLVRPDLPLDELREWVAAAWAGSVKAQDFRHLRAGTTVRAWENPSPAGYMAAYCRKGSSKEYQHELPSGFERPGRWWGLWGIAPDWRQEEVQREEFYALRRRFRKLLRSRGRRFRSRGDGGMWVASSVGSGEGLMR